MVIRDEDLLEGFIYPGETTVDENGYELEY